MSRTVRWLGAAALVGLGVLAAAKAGTFAGLVDRPVPDRATLAADGIAVFSGGPWRVAAALRLLRNKRAPRLLVAGGEDVEAFRSTFGDLMACCVDFHPGSRNTEQDAAAISAWAQDRAMRSVLVVTSDVHMPRAILELEAASPGLRLIAFPVKRARDSEGDRDLDLAREFAKWLVARTRIAARRALSGAIAFAGL